MVIALKVCREFSAERITAIANHPDVRPWLGGGRGPLDLSPIVADLRNVLLMGEGGGLMFVQQSPGIYEVHTQFLPEARGENAVAVTQDALRYMFTRTDAVEILSKVPDCNKGAKGLVRAINGTKRFHRDNAWEAPDGTSCGVDYYALTIQDWAGKCASAAASGEWFHGKLEAAKAELGASEPLHDHDEAHDRYVGVTVEMVLAGQVAKAVNFYNSWAAFSGYGSVAVIAVNPVLFDIGDAVLAVRNNDFEVMLCR